MPGDDQHDGRLLSTVAITLVTVRLSLIAFESTNFAG